MNKKIFSDKAPKAVGPYVHAVEGGGLLFVSGQLGINPNTDVLEDGIEEQAWQALRNMEAILETAGYSLEDVTKTTIFMKDMDDFSKVNEIYGEFFGEYKPARSCIQAAKLPKDGLIEIECLAFK